MHTVHHKRREIPVRESQYSEHRSGHFVCKMTHVSGPSTHNNPPWLFPKVKEACSTAALLRTLRHRTPTSTVPMLNTLTFASFVFENLKDALLDPQESKSPQSFVFTRCAGYLKIADGKQYTLLYTSVWNVFRNILCCIAFYGLFFTKIQLKDL